MIDKYVIGVLGSNRLMVILMNDICIILVFYSCIIFESNCYINSNRFNSYVMNWLLIL